MSTGLYLTEGILNGDIEAIVIVLIPFALAFWWFMRAHILPARQWKPPSGPKERTYFYRKKKVTAQPIRPARSGRRKRGEEAGTGGKPDASR
ncbi:MAG: hypothetical protein F4X14_15595 [Caldilineaceae bacterium SB0661_bin_32]|uniref:Uncharacterized protein n=1 Tax=Caldilineaceae bacterium SB0661_bin_32 TaxID=2605255 RepID=A0A6B1DBJ4_9CHLR|nr:hypothetical protein [Caldilineaceae bacterium SB0661_bin_32]